MHIDVTFPGGQAVDAHLLGHTIHTDQPVKHGGSGEQPAPFDLFLASIATCMGIYALQFCQLRKIDTDGLSLAMETERDPESKHIHLIRVELRLPAGFPPRYLLAVERALDQCAVKRHMINPPDFQLQAEVGPSRKQEGSFLSADAESSVGFEPKVSR